MRALTQIKTEDILDVVLSKGFKTFERAGVPNIVGIRNASPSNVDWYADMCFVWWYNDDGKREWHYYTITTSPGFYYMKNPVAGTHGTAILVPGQYLDAWELYMYRGKQLALIQTGGRVKAYRDSNRERVLNYDADSIEEGYFGIDLSHGSIGNGEVIEKYSAGRQVWKYQNAHEMLMANFKKMSLENNFKTFSYTLLLQEDFL